MMEHIIIPYVQKKCNTLKLDVEYLVILLMDIFKGQMTDPVKEILRETTSYSRKF